MKKLVLLALLLPIGAMGANLCVGPAATGSGTGADWNNCLAWSASPVRGDVWYLKDGTYPGKTLSTAVSGTTLITIKKAIGATGASGHGTDTGWVQSTMGNGQATITAELAVTSSYWVIDGQKGAGFSVLPPDITVSDYGISMTSGYRCVTLTPPAGNLTVTHCTGTQANNDTSAGSGWFVGSTSGSGTCDNITVSHCLMILWGQGICATFNAWNNLIFEYNAYWTIYASSAAHANPINASYGDINNATVRYSLFYKNVPGTWGFSQVIAANNANWNGGKIYGNVFDHCWAGRSTISGNGRSNDAVYNLFVYNNTFLMSAIGYNNDAGGVIGDEFSSGNVFKNNLMYALNAQVSSVSANDYNEYVSTWNHSTETHGVIITPSAWNKNGVAGYDPFTSSSGNVYSLKTNTPVGLNLGDGGEYGFDALGNQRISWTRGAYEFATSGGIAPTIQTQPTNAWAFVGNTLNNYVGASGSTPLYFQWYHQSNAVPALAISGQTNAQLALANAQTTDSTNANCVVITNSFGSITSSIWASTVTNQPSAAVIQVTPLVLNWPVQFTNTTSDLIVGVTNTGNASLTYSSSGGGVYTIVSGGSGTLAAGAGTTTTIRHTPTVQGQDSSTVTFTGGGGATVNVSGLAVSAFSTADMETTNGVVFVSYVATNNAIISPIDNTLPSQGGADYFGFHLAAPTSVSLTAWLEATNGANNSFWINIDGEPAGDNMCCDVTNLTSAGLNPVPVAWRGNGTFDAPQFNTNVWNLGTGDHWVVVRSREANTRIGHFALTTTTPPLITLQPQSQSVAVGGVATFTVSANGTPTLTYQWSKGGVSIGGATQSSYTTPAVVTGDDQSVFAVVVSNAQGSQTSQNATLTVSAATVVGNLTTPRIVAPSLTFGP